MEEKQNEFTEVEKIQKKGKDREIPPIEMSEENIRAMLDYFDSSILRSNILRSTKSNDPDILIAIINERTNDISILSSICYGLLNQRKSMKNEMEALQSQLDKLSETEKQLVQFQVLCEQYNQELKNKELAPNFQNLKERVNDLQDQNRRFLDEMFQLAQTRESFEMYEKSLVDRIVFEYKQKREETSSMTEQLHQFIQEFQQQQHEISELIIDNIDLRTQFLEEREKTRRLKKKLQNLKQKVKEKEAIESALVPQDNHVKKNYECHVYENSKDNMSMDSRVKEDAISLSPSGRESNRSQGRESSMQFQMIKNSQNSKLMKRWRELNEMEYSQGLNSILKSESEVPITKAFTFSSSSSVPLQSDSQSQIQPFDSQKSVFTRSTYPSVICVPKLELDSISTYSQMTPKTNHAHGIQNVSKTMSRFGFVASDEPMINPISMNKNKDDSKNSSLINSISKFFKG